MIGIGVTPAIAQPASGGGGGGGGFDWSSIGAGTLRGVYLPGHATTVAAPDQSGNGRDFDISPGGGPTVATVGGKKGWVFDGTQELSRAEAVFLDAGGPWTVGYAYTCPASAKGTVFKTGTAAGLGMGVGDTTADALGTNVVGVFEGVKWIRPALTHDAGGVVIVTVTPTGDSRWEVRVYKDGATDGSVADAYWSAPAAFSSIGAANAGRFFTGTIWGLAVYRGVLSGGDLPAFNAALAALRP